MKRALLLLVVLLAGCGYFNSLYNAERRFEEAERAARRGERDVAGRAYTEALERAAVSYRRYPDSRWADDALLLIGRSRFALGHYDAARVALSRALENGGSEDLRAAAATYLGATYVRLALPDSALPQLEAALAALDQDSELAALARTWRGRARLALGDASGWQDLETAAMRSGHLGVDAALELAARGLQADDSARTVTALATLAADADAGVRVDSVLRLMDAASATWGAAALLPAIRDDAGNAWQREPRTRVRHARARFLARSGDTIAAIEAAEAAARLSNAAAAARARQDAALWLVRRSQTVEDIARARAILLPAIADGPALQDIRRLRVLEVLLEQARAGQGAALFAAAEFARDTLRAPLLARQLFITYADVAASGVWAPKALLAALALTPGAERAVLLERIGAARDNVYVAAAHGAADDAAYRTAEERLGRAVAAVMADAVALAHSGDVRVTRAVAVLDSLRLLAHTDSMTTRCGSLLDSLALSGIRADSVRAACMRSDSALVTKYLGADTLQLRSGGAAVDTTRRLRPDTTPRPHS